MLRWVAVRRDCPASECSRQGPSPGGAICPASTRGGCLAKAMDQHLGVQRSSRFRLFLAGDPPSTSHWGHAFGELRSSVMLGLPILFVDLLASSCGLWLRNPRDQATHDAGGGTGLVFISSPCEAVVRVHNSVSYCSEVPSCSPLLGSDHFFVRCSDPVDTQPPT